MLGGVRTVEASLFEPQQEQTRRTSFSFIQVKYYRIRGRVTVCFTFSTCDDRTKYHDGILVTGVTFPRPTFRFTISRERWRIEATLGGISRNRGNRRNKCHLARDSGTRRNRFRGRDCFGEKPTCFAGKFSICRALTKNVGGGETTPGIAVCGFSGHVAGKYLPEGGGGPL